MPAARVIDLSKLSPKQGFTVQGAASVDFAGLSVSSAGDVNGDGLDDLIIGAIQSWPGVYESGKAYVVFGKNGATRVDIDLSALSANDGFIIQGDEVYDGAGSSVSSAGDVNGDGIDDLIVGAPSNDVAAGAAYVIFGKVGATRADIDLSALSASNGFSILGEAAFDEAGSSVSLAGDVNGDGIDDLIIGAPRNDTGVAYVIFGVADSTRADIDLASLSAIDGFIIQGEAVGDWAGGSVSAAGDINGDGIDDLIIGAKRNDTGGKYAGTTYVIFGQTGGTRADIDLSVLSASDGFTIQGKEAWSTAGFSISSAGDVNGDGIDDLIVGAPGNVGGGNEGGAAFVIFGLGGGTRADIDLSTLSTADGFVIQGGLDYFVGASVSSAGDVNGDGIDDLVVGANGIAYDNGAAYVIFGKTGSARSDINLGALISSDGFILWNGTAAEGIGSSVSSGGDINGDGFDDLIVGAPYSNKGSFYSGAAYVIFGSKDIGAKDIGVVPWSFTYAEPTDMLLFAQFATDAYNGTGDGRVSDVIDAPTDWLAFLSTDDGVNTPRYPGGTPGGIGGLPTFDTSEGSEELAEMQATAYKDASGRVVIAYRGTDDGNWEELVKTSFPLGAGENAGNALAYLQTAVNFYEAVVDSGVDPSMISFAGHSLGGIVAGYLAGITGSQAMIFASGPQSLLYERLDGLVDTAADMGYVTGAPVTDGIVHVRIDGEVLGESVDLAKTYGPATLGALVALLGGPTAGVLFGADLDSRYGDATVWGAQLAEFTSGNDLSSILPSTDLHRMQLHLTMLAAEKALGFTDYKDIPGFLSGMFDNDLAKSAQTGTIVPIYTAPRDLGSQMFSDLTLTYGGDRPDTLTPLLTQAETLIAPMMSVNFGLGGLPQSVDFKSQNITTALSQFVIEAAARSLHDPGVNFSKATGLIRATPGQDWITIDLSQFGEAKPWYGKVDLAEAILHGPGFDLSGLEGILGTFNSDPYERAYGAIFGTEAVTVFSPSGTGDAFTGTAANDLVIGGMRTDGTGVIIDGAGGDDVLIGGKGADRLTGGSGRNVLMGGDGNDKYYASGMTGSRALISDTGGNDKLYVDGTLPQLNVGTDRYGSGDLSLNVNGDIAMVEILDFFGFDTFGQSLRKGPGHIEAIFDGSGTKYAIAIGIEKVIGVVNYQYGKLKGGVNNVAVAAVDTVDKFQGKLSDIKDKGLKVLGFGEEDSFIFKDIKLKMSNFKLSPGSLIVDIDTDLDGVTDASFKLEGDYADFDVFLKTVKGNTVFRVIERADSKYDIYGTSADETVKGTSGVDRLGGLEGNDKLVGKDGKDVLYGGDGNDRLIGGGGADILYGGRGADIFQIGNTTDKVYEYAGQGVDTVLSWVDYTLSINVENLTLKGQKSISGTGNTKNNRINGNDKDNALNGLAGDDTINGKGGNDRISGGLGDDTLNGGTGMDFAVYTTAGSGVTVNLALGTAMGGDGTDTLRNLEGIVGSEFADILTGDDLENSVLAGAGDDVVSLGLGNDYAEGGAGNDTLKGGDGADRLLGGTGADSIDGQGGNDRIAGGLGDDTLAGNSGFDYVDYSVAGSAVDVNLVAGTATGGDGSDTLTEFEGIFGSAYSDILSGNSGKNTIRAGAGNDTIKGVAGADRLFGGDANDTIHGGTGSDLLYGENGDDRLIGGAGNDTLKGGAGNDKLTGGAGADVFVFNGMLAEGTDRILDFADGTDIIRIEGATFSDLTIAAATNGVDTQVTFSSGTVAILKDVDVSLIGAGDFVFV